MGYYAEGNGYVVVKDKYKNHIDEICDTLNSEFDYADNYDNTTISLGISGNYHDDDIIQLLDSIICKINDGEVTFAGESGDRWRFIFDRKNKRWEEQFCTAIIYDDDLSEIDTQKLLDELKRRSAEVSFILNQ